MASAKGCLKNGCLGCLGLIVLVLIITGIGSLVAWRDTRNVEPVEAVLAPESPAAMPGNEAFRRGGLVRLDLSEGEFYLYPADEGEGLQVEAVYDDNMYDLTQEFTMLADSTWVYDLKFMQTESGLRAFMRSIFAKGPDTKLNIYLPRDIPIDLETSISKGGMESDLGGLWLRNAKLDAGMGGFSLVISRPLKEPMESFIITSSMGGFEAQDLGNASPKVLKVDCRMGGADIGLDGAWMNDCLIDLKADMGGMSVRVPRDVEMKDGRPAAGLATEGETPTSLPVLYFQKSAKRGEIEIIR